MASTKEGIHLTQSQAEALYGALLMRPTVEKQLEELIALDPAWKSEKPTLEAHYNHLEAIYKAYGEHLYKKLPPEYQIPIAHNELLVHTSSGSVKFDANGNPVYNVSPE